MNERFEQRLSSIEYELSQIAESEYLEELKKKFNNELDVDVVLNIIPSRDISFKTRSLLSAILNRLELSQQDRLDLEKYIVYGGGDNIEYLKQTLAVWVEWKDKILNILQDAPEEFDSLVEIFNYINNHITESNVKLEEINNNVLNLNENVPFEKGLAENSAVLKGGNNQVISEGGVALGKDNLVGLKGWYYSAIRRTGFPNQITVFLSKTQKVLPFDDEPLLDNTVNIVPDKTLPNIYSLLGYGAEVSLVNDSKYDNAFILIGGGNGYVSLQTADKSDIPFTTIKHELLNDPEDYSIYCLSKPDKGMFDMGQGSTAGGYNNRATNGKATAFGYGNNAYGKFGFAEGRENEAGYAAHAEGRETHATGEQSHTEGRGSTASGNCSHAEGRYTESSGVDSHAEGEMTKAIGDKSHAEGYATNSSGSYSHAEGEGKIEGGAVSLLVGAHGRSSHVEGIATTTGEYNEQNQTWSKGDAAHAEGNLTIASGNHSHAEGSGTKATGWQAHSEGHNSLAKGNRSHTEGSGTEAFNLGEHAQGCFNKSTESADKSKATQFSIGIGTSATARKNAVEVKANGDVYIIGVGGFTGANSSSSKSVQEVINELVNKLNEITTSETN